MGFEIPPVMGMIRTPGEAKQEKAGVEENRRMDRPTAGDLNVEAKFGEYLLG